MNYRFKKTERRYRKIGNKVSHRRMTAVLTALVMVLSILPFSLFASAAGNQAKSGVALSVEAIQQAGIADVNFAQAIYDSIMAQPNQFEDGTSTVENNSFADVEDLLGHFIGNINAKDKGIEDITGMPLLKMPTEVRLENNKITDLTPLSVAKVEQEGEKHYGRKGINIQVYVAGNPLHRFREWNGGRIDIKDLQNTDTILNTTTANFLTDGNGNINKTFTFDIGVTQVTGENTERPFLYDESLTYLLAVDDEGNPGEVPEGGTQLTGELGGRISQLTISNISSTGKFWSCLAINNDYVITYMVSGMLDRATQQKNTAKWIKPVDVNFYTKAEGTATTDHAVTLTKTAEDTGSVQAGAEYSLFKKDGTPMQAGLTTGADGKVTISAGLTAGDYYFVETKAPDGYQLVADSIPFTVADGTIKVKGGVGSTLTTTDAGVQTLSNGVYAIAGGTGDAVTLEVTPPTGGALKELTVTWTKGNGTAGSKVCASVAEAEAAIEAARQLYQNVTVAASFTQELEVRQVNPLLPAEVTLNAKKIINGDAAKPVEAGKFSFNLQNAAGTDVHAQTKSNAAGGSVTFDKLSFTKTGTYNYTIAEVQGTDAGYEYDNTVYNVSIVVTKETDGLKAKVTYTPNNLEPGETYTDDFALFNNIEAKLPLQFTKVDAANLDSKLGGAEFLLYAYKGTATDGQNALLTEANKADWTLVDTKVSAGDTGLVDFGMLQAGTYRLVENKAPDGYQKPMGQWNVIVNVKDKTITFPAITENKVSTPPAFVGNFADGYKLTNVKNPDMPLTGGSGSGLFAVAGMALLAGAVSVFSVSYYKKRKNEENGN